MGFLRKHFAWVIIGVVLLVEIVAMVFVMGKQGAAQDARKQLEERRAEGDKLRAKTRGIKERTAVHLVRKDLVRRELGDCALFLWHQGQAIEGLFEADELKEYDLHPWQQARDVRDFGVFRVHYNGVYNREVEKLEPLMEKVGTERGALGLADPTGFAAATVEVGDIFVKQKEFWIRKELVQVLARHGALLQSISTVAPGAPLGPKAPHGKGPAEATRLATPLSMQIVIACDYQVLNALLEDLLRCPLCFRIESVVNVARAKLPEPVVAPPPPPRETPGPHPPKGKAPPPEKGPPPKEAKEPDETAPATAAYERRQFVTVTLLGHVPDINLELQEVLLSPKAAFSDKGKALEQVDRRIRALEKQRDEYRVAEPGSDGARRARPEQDVRWIRAELEKLKKAPPAEPGKELVVNDELGLKREYVFALAEAAENWLTHRYDFERAKLEAYLSLLRRVRRALDAGKRDDKAGLGVFEEDGGVRVSFRPPGLFDPNTFIEDIGQGASLKAKLGISMVKPLESREGVRSAPSKRLP